MIFRAKPRKGRDYYSVVTSIRIADKVREKTVLYIGRLDNLTEPERLEVVKNLEELAEPELIPKFHSILMSIGYSFPSPISFFSVEKVYEYGRGLALHKLCGGIEFF